MYDLFNYFRLLLAHYTGRSCENSDKIVFDYLKKKCNFMSETNNLQNFV